MLGMSDLNHFLLPIGITLVAWVVLPAIAYVLFYDNQDFQ